MSNLKGAILSLNTDTTKRAINEGKDVFVTFLNKKLETGNYLYIYGSGEEGARKIIAKAKIKNVKRMKPHEVWEKYKTRLFPTEKEFNEYTERRRNKEMLVLELKDPELLENPIKPPTTKNMTVAGLNVDKDLYEKIEEKIQ